MNFTNYWLDKAKKRHEQEELVRYLNNINWGGIKVPSANESISIQIDYVPFHQSAQFNMQPDVRYGAI